MTRTATEVGIAVLERLLATNAERQRKAQLLREVVRRISAENPDLSAKQIQPLIPLAEVGRTTPPSVRTIQDHLAQLRSTSVLR